ncbi:MAG: PAS domain-containing protein [Patulibacter sp.]|nr:PAS domain-containing protein [Patulibacter sp.]
MKREPEPLQSLLAGLVLALDVVTDHVVLLDGEGRIVHANVAWQRFALDNGDEETDWVGVDYVAASTAPTVRAGVSDPVSEGVRDVLAGRRPDFACEYDCHAPDEMRWFRLTVTRAQLPGISAIVTHTDITAQRTAERALEHHATHDRATGLANRAALEQHLRQLLEEGQDVSAIAVSLTVPGRPAVALGDDELVRAATTLRELFPAPARVGRWGPRALLIAQSGADEETLAIFESTVAAALREILGDLEVSATAVRIRSAGEITQLDVSDPTRLNG